MMFSVQEEMSFIRQQLHLCSQCPWYCAGQQVFGRNNFVFRQYCFLSMSAEIENHSQTFFFIFPHIGKHMRVIRNQFPPGTGAQGFVFMMQADQGLLEIQHAVRIGLLALYIPVRIIGIDRNPWNSLGEAGILLVGPLHGSARIIAVYE